MDDVPVEQRLYPAAVDYRAKHTPEKLFSILPKGDNIEDGFYDLNYRALAKAVDETAWWLDGVLGGKSTATKSSEFPAIPYVGANDFRYVLIILACMKTLRKAFLPLPTNTVDGQVKLLRSQRCDTVLASASHTHVWDGPASKMEGLKIIVVPEISHFIHSDPTKPYPYSRTASEGVDDTLWIIQTSGTTGDPKPIAMTTDYTAYWIAMHGTLQGPPETREVIAALVPRAYLPNLVPLSWGAAIAQVLAWPMIYGSVTVMMPATMPQPMTTDYVYRVITETPGGPRNGAMFVPSVLRELASDSKSLASLQKYEWIGYAGAPLDDKTGDLVSQYARVQSMFGSTDIGAYPVLLNDPKDWRIHRLLETDGFHFQHFADDLYELCARRQPNDHRHCFVSNPDPNMTVHHTKDLFRSVPGREGFYSTAGRVDDFVKLSSLTKFNAIDIEQVLDGNPDIRSSIVAGDARPKPFVIVEPSASLRSAAISDAQILDRIWPSLEEANANLHEEAHLTRELTLITIPEIPIKRTAKGTVDRRNTILMYKDQIDEMYDRVKRGI